MNSIPPLTRPGDCPPFRSQTDLEEHWRMLMGALGFSTRSLWLNVLDEQSRPTSVLIQIEDVPLHPDDEHLARVVELCQHFIPEGSSRATVVFLLTRPGGPGLTGPERAWARGLLQAVARAKLPVWPVHCANDHALVACAPDDLATSA